MSLALVRGELLYAWKGVALVITTPRGTCTSEQSLSGFYFREARFLRTLRIRLNGREPWLCEAAMTSADRLDFNYAFPELSVHGGGGTGQSGDDESTDGDGIPERAIDVQLTYQVGPGALDVSLVVTNHARGAHTIELTCELDADYADIQEASAERREQSAPTTRRADDGLLTFEYQHPQLPYRTTITVEGWRIDGERLGATLSLDPQASRRLTLHVAPVDLAGAMTDEESARRLEVLDAWRARFTRVTLPRGGAFDAVVQANIRDLASFPLLEGDDTEWLALQAGMPLYPAFFGRDAVTAGWQAAMLDGGEALSAAMTKLTRLQSNRVDDYHDEEPGRIPYQVRSGPLAVLGINPYAAYYADFASPLMFVIALGNLFAWTGDRERIRPHWDAARRILDWARTYGDPDGDGYLEYQTRSSKGTKNQGWKDSGDAVIYDDGSPVPSPVATCELQGYWYQAQQLMALLSAAMGAEGDADAHWHSAAALKARFNRDWWDEDARYFALALDPDKRRVTAVSSNVGHCLAAGIIAHERIPAVVGRMFAPDMFSGWGVRTLSSSHRFYNPLSYHRGTVWAVEQGTIVFGLRRFGFDARALDLSRALFDLALLYAQFRIPECVGGYARGGRTTPGAYPRANTPQLWNATAFPLVLQSMLGLLPLAPVETLVVDPVLPSWMPEIAVHGLRVGEATVSLRFHRRGDGSSDWDVLHKRGELRVVRQPPPESLTAGWFDRLAALLETSF